MSLSDLVHGWAEMEAALPEYIEAENYAENRISEIFAIRDGRLKSELDHVANKYRFNLIHIPITQRCDRMSIASIKVPGDKGATDRAQEVWDANDMAVHYPDLIEKTNTYGDAYTMVWTLEDEAAEDGDEDQEDRDMILAGVEFTVHNPKNTRVFYDSENPRRKDYAIFRWPLKNAAGQDVWRADVWYPDEVEHYISENGSPTQESGWKPYVDEDNGEWTTPNEHGEIPFFHHRTALPYGKPVHRFGYGPQNALNKMLITQLTTTDSQGWPQRYKLLRENAELDNADDNPQWLDDNDAVTLQPGGEGARGGDSSNQRAGAGTMATYSGVEEVGQFLAADPDSFLKPAELYIRLLSSTTNTPLHAFDPSMAGGVPSGESLKVAEAPLVKDIGKLITLQRGPVEEEWLFALRLIGLKVKAVEAKWAPVQSAQGLDDWQTVKAQQEAGVPIAQTLQEAGYESEQIDDWLDDDQEAVTLAVRIGLVGQIATAVRDLSGGIALGVITAEQANVAIESILGSAAGVTLPKWEEPEPPEPQMVDDDGNPVQMVPAKAEDKPEAKPNPGAPSGKGFVKVK